MWMRSALRPKRAASAVFRGALCAIALGAAPAAAAVGDSGTGAGDALLGAARLERGALIAAVLERNPTLRAARFAFEAAAAREPQADAFGDPTLDVSATPAAFGSSEVDGGWRIGLEQPLAFLGRRGPRARAARAGAEALAGDWNAARLELAAQASRLFDAYYFAARSVALSEQQIALLEELQRTATARYASGEGSQRDPLLAEMELARALQRRVSLAARERVVSAQLNALLHRAAQPALPPPPAAFEPSADVAGDAAALEAEALRARPDLRAQEARVGAARAALELVQRDFLPDLALSGGYDRIWQERDLRGFVGVELQLPLQQRARRGALAEAQALLARERSLLAAALDAARLELEIGRERLAEADHHLELFEARLWPAARDRAAVARAGFEAGRVDFPALLDALNGELETERELERARVEQSQRRSELQALLGRLPGAAGAAPGDPR